MAKGGEPRNGSKAERNTANMANIGGFHGTSSSHISPTPSGPLCMPLSISLRPSATSRDINPTGECQYRGWYVTISRLG